MRNRLPEGAVALRLSQCKHLRIGIHQIVPCDPFPGRIGKLRHINPAGRKINADRFFLRLPQTDRILSGSVFRLRLTPHRRMLSVRALRFHLTGCTRFLPFQIFHGRDIKAAVLPRDKIALRKQLIIGRLCCAPGNRKIRGERPRRGELLPCAQVPGAYLVPDISINLFVQMISAAGGQCDTQLLHFVTCLYFHEGL